MSEPEVSVITPCYNAGSYLSTCIESVIGQTFDDWEHLIVDDQSTDGSLDTILRYSQTDERVKLIVSDDKLGASKARNLAIKNARGKYVAFLDADDWWAIDKLEMQLKEIRAADAKFCCSSYSIVDETAKLMRIQNAKQVTKWDIFTKRTVIGCLTVLYDRNYFKNFRFRENMAACEDYEMWCRMISYLEGRGGVSIATREPLAFYRVHRGGKSYKKFARLQVHWRIYRHDLQLSILEASWCLINYAINGIRDRI